MKPSNHLTHSFGRLLVHEAKQVAGNSSHLDFFGSLSDSIAAMVSIDVLEWFMA
jgi:hypothetical protein